MEKEREKSRDRQRGGYMRDRERYGKYEGRDRAVSCFTLALDLNF